MTLLWLLLAVDTCAVQPRVVVPPGVLNWPHALAWSPKGGFWVGDRGPSRIHLFSPEGEALLSFGRWGQSGLEFSDRVSIADPGGPFLYVADVDAGRILKLTRDGSVVREIRHTGTEPWRPVGMAALPDGRVFVGDETTGRVFLLDSFDRLRRLPSSARSLPLLMGSLAVGPFLALTDRATGRVSFFDLLGNTLSAVSVGVSAGAVAMRADGTVVVVDEARGDLVLAVRDSVVRVVRLGFPAAAVCAKPGGEVLVADAQAGSIVALEVGEASCP